MPSIVGNELKISRLLGFASSVLLPLAVPCSAAQADQNHDRTDRCFAASNERHRTAASAQLHSVFDSISPSSGWSLYIGYNLGLPALQTVFYCDRQEEKKEALRRAAALIGSLPTIGEIAEAGATLDKQPLPTAGSARRVRTFPISDGEKIAIASGNIHQFSHFLSTLVAVAARDDHLMRDRESRQYMSQVADFLLSDVVRFYWLEAPAWHWNGAYAGMRERSLERLHGEGEIDKRRFFRAFLDYDLHVMAVAADLRAASNGAWTIPDARGRQLLDDVENVSWAVLQERISVRGHPGSFAFDRGYWDDNPIAQYAACHDHGLPARPCPLSDYTSDVSHAQRWPYWLDSFEAGAPTSAKRAQVERWRQTLADTVALTIRYVDDRPLMTNFLDGRDGWFLTTESVDGINASPPSSLTGWALRYGAYSPLARNDIRIERAYRRFCEVIISDKKSDVDFRTEFYGSPEGNSRNGTQPPADEFGSGSEYGKICAMLGFGD